MLIELYQQRFGDHIPLIRRQDVKGFIKRRPVWLTQKMGLDAMRKRAESMEFETRRFYEQAAQHRATPGYASCWAIWRKSNASTPAAPENWRRNIFRLKCAMRRTWPAGVCSCCKSCSRDSRG